MKKKNRKENLKRTHHIVFYLQYSIYVGKKLKKKKKSYTRKNICNHILYTTNSQTLDLSRDEKVCYKEINKKKLSKIPITFCFFWLIFF